MAYERNVAWEKANDIAENITQRTDPITPLHIEKIFEIFIWIVKECYTRQKNGSDNDDREYRHISSIGEATYLYLMGFRIEGDLIIRCHIEHCCACCFQ
jgi:hypothetical protein